MDKTLITICLSSHDLTIVKDKTMTLTTDKKNIPVVVVGGVLHHRRENGANVHSLRYGKHPCCKRLQATTGSCLQKE